MKRNGEAELQPNLPALSEVRIASREKSARTSELVFLLQVSRPGLWSTTALFYLMPLGHADLLHSRTLWLGLFYVLFPLGFLLYGVNDIVDAEADRVNPRKGTFLFGSLGAAEQLAALRWKIAAVQIPFLIHFLYSCWAANPGLVRCVLDCCGTLQCAAVWVEEPSSFRRTDSGELSAGFCAEQLAERRLATSVADFSVWGFVRDALAHLSAK